MKMTTRLNQLQEHKNQQINFGHINSIHTENPSVNQFQKYNVVKMISTGDYVCTDRLGNKYLLVCQPQQYLGGVVQFNESIKFKFHRNSSNRALLTPFQDIEHNGLVFTVFMIPEMAENIKDSLQTPKSEIFCLSILFSFINKVLKPLIEIFANDTWKWLHGENIWFKQNTIYYVLSKRKQKKTNFSFSPNKQKNNEYENLKSQNQKKLLRLLCNILIPYFKIDHQLKSFQSIIFDSMINQQFTIDQILQLLNDKKKRRQFINQRKQQQIVVDNNRFQQILKQNGEFWRKKKYSILSENRRQLTSFSQHVRAMHGLDLKQDFNKTNRNRLGQTIVVPRSFQTRRSSLAMGMFDFREKSKRKNKSVSEQKSVSRYGKNTFGHISASQQIQKTLRTHVKYYKTNVKQYSVNVNVKQRSFRKFTQSIPLYDDNIPNQARIDQKQLRSYLIAKQNDKLTKSKTIDVGDLKQRHVQKNVKPLVLSYKQPNGSEITRKLKMQQPKIENEDTKHKKIQHNQKLESLQQNRLNSVQNQQIRNFTGQKIVQQKKLALYQCQDKKIQRNTSEKFINKAQKLANNSIFAEAQKIDVFQIQTMHPKLKQQVNIPIKTNTNMLNNSSTDVANKPPLPKFVKEKAISHNLHNDELEEVILAPTKKQNNKRKQSFNSSQGKQRQKQKVDIKHSSRKKNQQEIKSKQETESNKRVKTVASEIPSACGPKKPVSKQINQYMHMINKIGESVAKSSRISSKLEGIQWFTGIYFIYKRFLFQRKNVENWLQKKIPNITRYSQKNKRQWDQWFASEEKKDFEIKLKTQNENIVTSIVKMNKKMIKKKLHPTLARHIPLSQHHQQESKIAVSQIIQQYDTLEQQDKLSDQQIISHMNDLMNSIYVIGQLDEKIIEKKPLAQIFKKRNVDQLSAYSDFLYELYIQDQEQE